jgi:hypothetical protein
MIVVGVVTFAEVTQVVHQHELLSALRFDIILSMKLWNSLCWEHAGEIIADWWRIELQRWDLDLSHVLRVCSSTSRSAPPLASPLLSMHGYLRMVLPV